jgi:hypothetical protein
MKRLLSILLAGMMLLGIVAIAPSAGAEKKYIYEADLVDLPIGPANPTNLIVISYAHVTIDPNFNVDFKIKTDQLDSVLGAAMAEGYGTFRHSVYLGEIRTDAEGNGKATFNLKAENVDRQVPGPYVIEPSFRLFSLEKVTGRPNAGEAGTLLTVYPTPTPPAKGRIRVNTVLPQGCPAPSLDLSWQPLPVTTSYDSGYNLNPRYYAITKHDPTGWESTATIEDLGSGDSFQLGTPAAWDRTLIVNLAPGELVTVTYTYKAITP